MGKNNFLRFGEVVVEGGHAFLPLGPEEAGVLPPLAYARFPNLPEKLLIRESYVELYELLTKGLKDAGGRGGGVVTGVPGIGNSVFGLYFVYRFINDPNFQDKRIAFEYARGAYQYAIPGTTAGTYECYSMTMSEFCCVLNSRPRIIVSDYGDMQSPANFGDIHFVFSSPNEKRFDDFLDNFGNHIYWMPPWDANELEAVKPNRSDWDEAYRLFGGVPRTVFNFPPEYAANFLADALMKRGGKLFYDSVTYGVETAEEPNADYMILHKTPLKDDTGHYQYGASPETAFASTEMFSRLISLNHPENSNAVRELFNQGARKAIDQLGSVGAHQAFKCILRDPIIMHKSTFSATYLETDGEQSLSRQLDISVPTKYRSYNAVQKIQENVLYWPSLSICAGADFFFIARNRESPGNYDFFAGQITIAAKHEINIKELDTVFKAIPQRLLRNISKLNIWFLTPQESPIDACQAITGKINVTLPTLLKLSSTSSQYVSRVSQFPRVTIKHI
jgi:hypothetical protein